MEDRRKVLFADGMSSDFLLIITDAPKEAIENYCRYHNRMMEDGGYFEVFDCLKVKYYVKELLDSEIDEKEDLEIIGYDEAYDFSQYTERMERMNMNKDQIRISGIVFEHGKDDYGFWEGFNLTEDEEDQIMEILMRHDTEGCSIRGTRKDIIKEIGE